MLTEGVRIRTLFVTSASVIRHEIPIDDSTPHISRPNFCAPSFGVTWLQVHAKLGGFYLSPKLNSMVISTLAGEPSLRVAGLNRHFLRASNATSSVPSPTGRTILMFSGIPASETSMRKITLDPKREPRANLSNAGPGSEITCGAEMGPLGFSSPLYECW
jgi:hypothetical protein